MQEIDLTPTQRQELASALTPFAQKFDVISVYGSRAMGKAHRGSDVDLVIYGAQDDRILSEIQNAVAESDLSIFADILRYETIRHAPLKSEIDRHAKMLFHRAELVGTLK